MPSPIFCSNCGNNDREGFDIEEDIEYRIYICQLCFNIIDKIPLILLRDVKYQREGVMSKK